MVGFGLRFTSLMLTICLVACAGAASLYLATDANNTDRMQRLIDSGHDVNAPEPGGQFPIIAAIGGNNREALDLLVANGADVDIRMHSGRTPMHSVARSGNVEYARYLIEHGASIDIADYYDQTPLLVAAANNRTSVLTLLAENGAELQHVDASRRNALDLSLENNSSDSAHFLAARGLAQSEVALPERPDGSQPFDYENCPIMEWAEYHHRLWSGMPYYAFSRITGVEFPVAVPVEGYRIFYSGESGESNGISPRDRAAIEVSVWETLSSGRRARLIFRFTPQREVLGLRCA